jgi:prepilin-type N-terminal cleavage/methylation domain-containing protein
MIHSTGHVSEHSAAPSLAEVPGGCSADLDGVVQWPGTAAGKGEQMLNKNKTSRRGFTITEILIAVLLVLILSAIAVPRLLGNQRQAEDTAAKAQLRTSAEVARNLMYESGNRFDATKVGAPTSGSTQTQLSKDEPNIEFVTSASIQDPATNRRSVSVNVVNNTEWVAAALGGSSGGKYNCWFVKLSTTGGDKFGLLQKTAGSTANSCSSTSDVPTTWVDYEFPALP